MNLMASQITSLTIVYSTVYSGADQRKKSKLSVTGLCAGNSPGTGEFSAQMASNAKNVSIWWRHHAIIYWRIWVSLGGDEVSKDQMNNFVNTIWAMLIGRFNILNTFQHPIY